MYKNIFQYLTLSLLVIGVPDSSNAVQVTDQCPTPESFGYAKWQYQPESDSFLTTNLQEAAEGDFPWWGNMTYPGMTHEDSPEFEPVGAGVRVYLKPEMKFVTMGAFQYVQCFYQGVLRGDGKNAIRTTSLIASTRLTLPNTVGSWTCKTSKSPLSFTCDNHKE